MSFLQEYFHLERADYEVAVCCPFPHTNGAKEYFEINPSAHVNMDEGLFHCKVCDTGYNEITFIKAIFGCTLIQAKRFFNTYKHCESADQWKESSSSIEDDLKDITILGINRATIKELNLMVHENRICFPVLMYNKLLDIRKYNPKLTPKVKSRSHAISGLIIPYDTWTKDVDGKTTLICAGEKDMAIARSNGFNAITITGGEQSLPITLNDFKNKKITIVYDNDDAGKLGARKLANRLYPVVDEIKVCTKFHEVCKEPKEDITDFFMKYNKSREDLIKYMRETELYTPSDIMEKRNLKRITLHQATKPKYLDKLVRSNVQVVATSEATFTIPSIIQAEKFLDPSSATDMQKGTTKEWELTEDTVQGVLHLCDNNFKEMDIKKNIRGLLKIMQKESGIKISKYEYVTIYKSYVTDMFETTDKDTTPTEFIAYSINTKLISGKKYLVDYKLVAHPYKGQQLTMLVLDTTQANDSISNFKITPGIKESLQVFQHTEGTLESHVYKQAEKFKTILGYNGNKLLILTMDLAWHTVLSFNFNNQPIRGYLDTLIVSESRVGKSSTAEAMRNLYRLGTITSLAGNSATVPGLIGGSNKVQGSFQTRAGIIPQNHKGLVVFEELGKSNSNLITELTDIRSSNEVRITRVAGTLTMPALVRMIMLSNVKTFKGNIKSIASYPHGISILKELVGSAEDIARYDIALILKDRGTLVVDYKWESGIPHSEQSYLDRIRWIWSRKPEQIYISDINKRHLIDKANELSKRYDCHIKIFGTETWKKLARIAIAIAGYTVSTDDKYEQIIVSQNHINFAATYLETIYDNSTFKFKEYVKNEKRYSMIDQDGVDILQDLFIKVPILLLHLEQVAETSKNTIQAVTGLNNDDYHAILSRLTTSMFTTFDKYDIQPTERFRKGMAKINRNVKLKKRGELV